MFVQTVLLSLLITSVVPASINKPTTLLNRPVIVSQTVNTFIENTENDVLLDVPFIHQIEDLPEDKKAFIRTTACGPASIAMVLNYIGHEQTLYEVIDVLPNTVYVKGSMFYNLDEGPQYFNESSVSFKHEPKEIFRLLQDGNPIILNVQNYDGITGHAVVIVGMKNFNGETAESLIVHDPFVEAYREFKYLSANTLLQPEGYTLYIGILDPFYIPHSK